MKSGDWNFGTNSSTDRQARSRAPTRGNSTSNLTAWGPLQRAFGKPKADSPARSIDHLELEMMMPATSGAGGSSAARERAPVATPVTDKLEAACHASFEALDGPLLQATIKKAKAEGWHTPDQDQRLNEVGARAVHETLRAHFKGKDKASNKRYVGDASAADPVRAEEIEQRLSLKAAEREQKINSMRDNGAPLEDHLAAGIANCMEMSMASVLLARSLGLKANTWMFMADEDPLDDNSERNHTSHAYCVIGEVASTGTPGQPMEKLELHGDLQASHLQAVDVWSGVCCPSSDFDRQFDLKMKKWDDRGKQVKHWDRADSPEGRWIRPTSLAWKEHTTGSPHPRRKNIQAYNGYVPE